MFCYLLTYMFELLFLPISVAIKRTLLLLFWFWIFFIAAWMLFYFFNCTIHEILLTNSLFQFPKEQINPKFCFPRNIYNVTQKHYHNSLTYHIYCLLTPCEKENTNCKDTYVIFWKSCTHVIVKGMTDNITKINCKLHISTQNTHKV